jgi:hypothetical protein
MLVRKKKKKKTMMMFAVVILFRMHVRGKTKARRQR